MYKKRNKDGSTEEALINVLYATYLAHSDLTTARTIATKAVKSAINEPEVALHAAYIELLWLQHEQKNNRWSNANYQSLVDKMNNLRRHFPLRIEDENTLQQLYILGGDADKATSTTLSALDISPKNSHLHYTLAELYLISKDFNAARKHFERVLTLSHDPNTAKLIKAKIEYVNGSINKKTVDTGLKHQ